MSCIGQKDLIYSSMEYTLFSAKSSTSPISFKFFIELNWINIRYLIINLYLTICIFIKSNKLQIPIIIYENMTMNVVSVSLEKSRANLRAVGRIYKFYWYSESEIKFLRQLNFNVSEWNWINCDNFSAICVRLRLYFEHILMVFKLHLRSFVNVNNIEMVEKPIIAMPLRIPCAFVTNMYCKATASKYPVRVFVSNGNLQGYKKCTYS